jgi:hypothetical protein
VIVVLDAAAAVDVLLDNERGRGARRHLEGAQLFSVAHLDAEVFELLTTDGRLSGAAGDMAIDL